jgi:hypothetical protein
MSRMDCLWTLQTFEIKRKGLTILNGSVPLVLDLLIHITSRQMLSGDSPFTINIFHSTKFCIYSADQALFGKEYVNLNTVYLFF